MKKPNKELIELYADIHILCDYLAKDIDELILIKKEVLSHPWLYEGKEKTGILGLKKGEFLEETLLPKIKYLGKTAFNSHEEAKKYAEKAVVSEEDRLELERTLRFLEEVRKIIPSEKGTRYIKTLGDSQKIASLENISREVTKLGEEYKLDEEGEIFRGRVLAKEISPLIRRVFNAANEDNHFSAKVIKKEFKAIVREARQLESFHDPKNRIFWRRWWRKSPKIEIDPTTGINEPHANINIILDGQKKTVHLFVR